MGKFLRKKNWVLSHQKMCGPPLSEPPSVFIVKIEIFKPPKVVEIYKISKNANNKVFSSLYVEHLNCLQKNPISKKKNLTFFFGEKKWRKKIWKKMGQIFFSKSVSRQRYALVAHMIYQNVQVDEPLQMGTFPFPVSTISVSGLRFFAFFSTWVRRSEKCQSNDPP